MSSFLIGHAYKYGQKKNEMQNGSKEKAILGFKILTFKSRFLRL